MTNLTLSNTVNTHLAQVVMIERVSQEQSKLNEDNSSGAEKKISTLLIDSVNGDYLSARKLIEQQNIASFHEYRFNYEFCNGDSYIKVSPLWFVSRYGNTMLCKEFCDSGANLESHPYCSNGVDGKTPLLASIMGGHKKIVKILLEKGANPQAVDSTGVSADDLNYVFNYTERETYLCIKAMLEHARSKLGYTTYNQVNFFKQKD